MYELLLCLIKHYRCDTHQRQRFACAEKPVRYTKPCKVSLLYYLVIFESTDKAIVIHVLCIHLTPDLINPYPLTYST